MVKVQMSDASGRTRFGGLELIDVWRTSEDALIWVDLHELPLAEEAAIMQGFGIHENAIEDAQSPRHPPKMEQFGEYVFLLVKGLDARTSSISFGTIQIAIFAGHGFLLTRHAAHSPSIERLWSLTKEDASLLRAGPASLAIGLIDIIMDRYLPILLAVEDRVDWLEDEIAERPRDELLSELISLKSNLTRMRRITTYHSQVFAQLSHTSPPGFGGTLEHDLRDTFEKLERLASLTSLYYDLAADLMDGYISLASHRLNNIMKVLTIVASIFIPLTFIAGVYGMNFQNIPELNYRYSYYIIMGLMVVIGFGLIYLFRKKQWL